MYLRRDDDLRDLSKYRLDRAVEFLSEANALFQIDSFKGSINRSYYAIFTAVRALLAEEKKDFKKHSAVIAYFRQHYIKTGIFDVKFSKYIGDAFDFRNDCDYEDFIFVSHSEAQTQLNNATEFLQAVKNYLEVIQ